MAYFDTPMTKLDAVNVCLSAMGEPKITSLDTAGIDAQMASDLVDEVTREVQGAGWHWNRETHTLSPDVNGYMVLPANTLRVDTIEDDMPIDVIQRGGRLYNKVDNTYVFDSDLKLEIIVALQFEDLPFAAKNFITYRSARRMQQRALGSETLQKFNEHDENRAWVLLLQDEAATQDSNMLSDSWSTQSILTRGTFARGAY